MRFVKLPNLLSRRHLSVAEAERLLGIPKSSSQKEIKKAYLEKAKKFHPDNQKSGNAEKFRDLKKAAEILENPAKAEINREDGFPRRKYNPDSKYERAYQNDQKTAYEKRKDDEHKFGYNVGGYVIIPCLLVFGLFRLIGYVKEKSKEGKVRLEPLESTPSIPFEEKFAKILIEVKRRKQYKFSIKQLVVQYRNYIRQKHRPMLLDDKDILKIGALCHHHPDRAIKVLDNPALLDSYIQRFDSSSKN